MVSVNNLVKTYGSQRAVDGISFEAKKGEILGFLGPNGAGKSTTMKILTCYLPKTSGEASVCGLDVEKDSLEVRKKIGYLPEHNPLYKDMYVREYLECMAGANGVKNAKARVSDLVEQTGLTKESHKHIGALSKGYRQRVGLAQAMLHNPEVLILDEPTSGLDPNQLVEIRSLIKEIGKEKTVIFSTHIMQEVQALCDRVVIIANGKLVADDDIATLQSRVTGESVIHVEFASGNGQMDALKRLNGVKKVESTKGQPGCFSITASKKLDIRPDIFKYAVDNKFIILEMRQELSSIEDVFQSLTKTN